MLYYGHCILLKCRLSLNNYYWSVIFRKLSLTCAFQDFHSACLLDLYLSWHYVVLPELNCRYVTLITVNSILEASELLENTSKIIAYYNNNNWYPLTNLKIGLLVPHNFQETKTQKITISLNKLNLLNIHAQTKGTLLSRMRLFTAHTVWNCGFIATMHFHDFR